VSTSKIKEQTDSKETAGAAESARGLTVSRSFIPGSRKPLVVIVCLLIALIVCGGVSWWLYSRRGADAADANSTTQAALQKELALDLAHMANQSVLNDTTKLINGKLAGKYTFSDKLLAQYYMYAGAAYTNLKEYDKAVTAYKAAPKYSGTETQAALEGQLYAGYRSGERKQLIPILEQLVTLSKQHPDPFGTSSGHYEKDIQALQNNQEISL